MKKFDEFINESISNEDLVMQLYYYIAEELNKRTEDLVLADPIEKKDVTFHTDITKSGVKWFYGTLQSKRLSTEPQDDSLEDHINVTKQAVKGAEILDEILEEIYTHYGIVVHTMISKGGQMHHVAIKLTIEEPYIDQESNDKITNFLKSNHVKGKYNL
jgi:hypothetical protein